MVLLASFRYALVTSLAVAVEETPSVLYSLLKPFALRRHLSLPDSLCPVSILLIRVPAFRYLAAIPHRDHGRAHDGAAPAVPGA